MGVYCYRNSVTNEIIDRTYDHNAIPEKIMIDGVKWERDYASQWQAQAVTPPACYPMKSQSMGCNPCQIKEYEKFCNDHGVNTHYDSRGRAEFRSKAHRKAHCELMGATDFDGGFGDPICEGNKDD